MKRKTLLLLLLAFTLVGCEQAEIETSQESASLEASIVETSEEQPLEENKGRNVTTGPLYDFAVGLMTRDPDLLYSSVYVPLSILPDQESFQSATTSLLEDYFQWDVYEHNKDELYVYAKDGYIDIEVYSQEMGPIHDRYDLTFPTKDGKVVFDELYQDVVELQVPASVPFSLNGKALEGTALKKDSMKIYNLNKVLVGAYTVSFEPSYLDLDDYTFYIDGQSTKQTVSLEEVIGGDQFELTSEAQAATEEVITEFMAQVLDQIADDSTETIHIDSINSTLNKEAKLVLMEVIEEQIDTLNHYNDPKFLDLAPYEGKDAIKTTDQKNYQVTYDIIFRIERKILQLPKNVVITMGFGVHNDEGKVTITSIFMKDGIRDFNYEEGK